MNDCAFIDHLSLFPSTLTRRVRLREQSQPPGQTVVVATSTGILALIQISDIARAERHSLIDIGAHRLAMTDILGPGRPRENDVTRAGKWIALRGGERGPRRGEAGRGPRAEIATAVAADGLDDEEVLTSNVVHVGGLEEVVGVGVRKGDDGVGHAVREGGEGGLRAVEVAVVVRGEEIAGGAVADEPHVDPVALADVLLDEGGLGAVEVGGRAPAGGIADVGVGRVGGVAVLEDQVPEVLRGEVEDLRRGAVARPDGGLVEVVEGGGVGLAEVAEAEVYETVAGFLRGGGEDMVLAVVVDDGRVFDAGDAAPVVLG